MNLAQVALRACCARKLWLWLAIDTLVVTGVVFRAAKLNEPYVPEVSARMLQIAAEYRAQYPQVGDLASDFRLTAYDRLSEVALSSFRGERPVVLVFGSYTCPVFRQRATMLNEAYEKYKDRAEFFFIYIREAHPEEEGQIPENKELGALISQATNLEERLQVAQTCAAALRIRMPILLDHMDNSTARTYGAWPERLYVIDARGRVAHSGSGPGDVDVPAMSRVLEGF